MYRLRLDKETCNKIAEAMVHKWTDKPGSFEQLIIKYYELDKSWNRVVDYLTADLYSSISCCGDDSFQQLLELLFPSLEEHLYDLWRWYEKEDRDEEFPDRDWFPRRSNVSISDH